MRDRRAKLRGEHLRTRALEEVRNAACYSKSERLARPEGSWVRTDKLAIQLEGFSSAEEEMIESAIKALQAAGYGIHLLRVLIRAELPPDYRGMCLEDGAVLGKEAFSSQAMLNHVLEEELLHQGQKASGLAQTFKHGTARELEDAINAKRKFPLPDA